MLVTHLGKECSTCSSGRPAGHVLTREQEQLLSRAADLEAEQRQHAAAADEAARIAAAAAARASELESEIRVEISERRTLLLQHEDVGAIGRREAFQRDRSTLLDCGCCLRPCNVGQCAQGVLVADSKVHAPACLPYLTACTDCRALVPNPFPHPRADRAHGAVPP